MHHITNQLTLGLVLGAGWAELSCNICQHELELRTDQTKSGCNIACECQGKVSHANLGYNPTSTYKTCDREQDQQGSYVGLYCWTSALAGEHESLN